MAATADPTQLATALLLPGAVQEQVRAWLKEDVPSGFDVGGFVVGGTYACACDVRGVNGM